MSHPDLIPGAVALSAPERFALTGVGVAGAATLWPTLMGATGVGLPCPLRMMTGIPCPFCGMTTASIHLVRGRIFETATTNPMVFLIAVFTIVMLGVLALRRTGRLSAPPTWSTRQTKICIKAIATLAAISWVFQLNRFGLI